MIVAAVVCPHPPLLVRELSGVQDAVPELRAACRTVLAAVIGQDVDTVMVLGGGEQTAAWDASLPLGVRRFGTTAAPDGVVLPQSLGIGRRLLDEAGWRGPVRMHTVAWTAAGVELADTARVLLAEAEDAGARVALLVLADGSARRGEKAPGHLDERAFAFDDLTSEALAQGDAKALAGADATLATDLMAGGRAALAVLGELVLARGSTPDAEVAYRDDPFGVDYVVARWDLV